MRNCRCAGGPRPVWLLLACGLLATGGLTPVCGQTLQSELQAEEAAALAKAAEEQGDAQRGALLFHQQAIGCVKCHDQAWQDDSGAAPKEIGPNLTQWERKPETAELVEAVLEPSKKIRQGYETVTALLDDGRVVVGVLMEETGDTIVLRNPSDGAVQRLPKNMIEEHRIDETSVMPADVINQLDNRQQFLDLIKYLVEMRDGGLERAREFQPHPSLLALQLPEYESRVDHAGLIGGWNDESFKRGESIYRLVCANCHGTHDEAGSLPTSLRFATGTFKNGSDPYAMYQTITRGFGQMTPQTQLVPRQKYDVIHYIREAYLKTHNPSQYAELSSDFLQKLPPGNTRGPRPRVIQPWATMDYGPSLINTYEFGDDGANFAYKGIAARLDRGAGGVAAGRAWQAFDHDTLRMAAAWTGEGFIDWNGIHFNGRHGIHPRATGAVALANPTGPGWANPETLQFADEERVAGRDGRRYGPLPRAWGRYRGLYHHGDKIVISYTVGSAEVLEIPGMAQVAASAASASGAEPAAERTAFTRAFQIGPRDKPMRLLVATHPEKGSDFHLVEAAGAAQLTAGENDRLAIFAGYSPKLENARWTLDGPRLCLDIPAGDDELSFTLWMTRAAGRENGDQLAAFAAGVETHLAAASIPQFKNLTRGGPRRWPETLATEAVLGNAEAPFAVDVLTHPQQNPWLAQVRFTGIDFYPDGDRALVCAWDGDVWLVEGLNGLAEGRTQLAWRRIACGLFQPLGIKIVDGKPFVICRDQLTVLHDLNGDGETDYYECFNNDHQVTEHFHEFAMGLQTDAAGNFYYAKSARHALPAVVPHHGTLLRISADGAKTDILANGFRAANGVCLNADGTFVVTDQEGHWNPKNRINWVREGGFYGNMFGYHDKTDETDSAMEQPLCWITNAFDRSPGELLWTPDDAWGPLAGSLLNLSYGYGKIFVVPFEEVDGHKQGGMCALPFGALPTGVMRGRFHPRDRQLYACGMFAWAGSATQPGGLYRIRHTGQPMHLPRELRTEPEKIAVTFTDPLDRAAACDVKNYAVKTWSLRRTANYGSGHHDEKRLEITAAELSPDGRAVTLTVPNLEPTWCMEIVCRLQGENGERFERVIHNSVFALGAKREAP